MILFPLKASAKMSRPFTYPSRAPAETTRGGDGTVEKLTTANDHPSHLTPRVSYLVYRLERRLRTRLDQATRAHGVTTTEYVTLSVLRNRDGMSNAQLARLAFVTRQAMNTIVSSLERRELISRTPAAENRRILRASVTPAGLAILGRCEASMDAIEADMLAGLSPPTTEVLRSALGACAQSLESHQ
jgi:DNA-binding MarR family transcriptional regulator